MNCVDSVSFIHVIRNASLNNLTLHLFVLNTEDLCYIAVQSDHQVYTMELTPILLDFNTLIFLHRKAYKFIRGNELS